MDYHVNHCKYRNYECPFSNSESKCNWTGLKPKIETHLRTEHLRYFLIQKSGVCVTVLDGVSSNRNKTWLEFFQFRQKKYIVWIRKQSSTWFFNIQLIGSECETAHLDCTISFLDHKGSKPISWGGTPQSIQDRLDPDNLKAADLCLQLEDHEVGPYINRNQLIVTIHIVDSCRQRERHSRHFDAYAATVTRRGRIVKPIRKFSESDFHPLKRPRLKNNS